MSTNVYLLLGYNTCECYRNEGIDELAKKLESGEIEDANLIVHNFDTEGEYKAYAAAIEDCYPEAVTDAPLNIISEEEYDKIKDLVF